jgi:hypothetical protein
METIPFSLFLVRDKKNRIWGKKTTMCYKIGMLNINQFFQIFLKNDP